MTAPVYIALVHYPILNKHGEIVTTAITNFDIHDLARTSRTYGVARCFLVTPNKTQQGMVAFITKHWSEGYGALYNPDRKAAFESLELADNLEQTCLTIKNAHGSGPTLIATSARHNERSVAFGELKRSIQQSQEPYLVVFGTGWGLAPSVLEQARYVLEPIHGPVAYNHLPVRAAVAIVLDRLLGKSS